MGAQAGARRRPRAFQRIVSKVSADVFGGRLRPGDRLPHEEALAARFGVSRPALREALRVLEMAGLVRVEHGFRGGAFVAEPDGRTVGRALDTMVRLERVDRSEIYSARSVIEPAVTALAARSLSEADAAALAQAITEAERRLAAGESAHESNLAFHALLSGACGNRVLALVTQAVLELLHEVEPRVPSGPAANREACRAHRAILEALRQGDAEAAERRMREHLASLERALTRRTASRGAA